MRVLICLLCGLLLAVPAYAQSGLLLLGVGPGGAPAFSPSSLSPAFWFEAKASGGLAAATNGTSPITTDGANIQYAKDLSASALHLTNANANATRPTSGGFTAGAPYVNCVAGSSQVLFNAGTFGSYTAGHASWFIAMRAGDTATSSITISEGAAGGNFYSLNTSSASTTTSLTAFIRNDAVATVYDRTGNDLMALAMDGTDHVYGEVDNGTTITPYIDGIAGTPVSYTRSGTFAVTPTTAGICALLRGDSGSVFFTGRIYSVVIGNVATWTSAQIKNLTVYMQGTYKIPNTTNYLVANNTEVPQAIDTSVTNNRTDFIEVTSHPDCNITAIQTVNLGWYLNTGTASNSATYTMGQSIDYPIGTTLTSLKWATVTSKAVTAGTTVVSDSLAIAIPKATKFRVRTANVGGSTITSWPAHNYPAPANSITNVNAGTDATLKLTSGTIANSAGPTFMAPAAIIGTTDCAPPLRSYVMLGDSITWGQGETASASSLGLLGWPLRMTTYPAMKIGAQGAQVLYFLDAATAQKMRALLDSINYTGAVVAIGGNDLSSGGAAAAVIELQVERVAAQLGFYGQHTWIATISPKVTTTDSMATVANETPVTTGTWSSLTTVNDAIRAFTAFGWVALQPVLDAADQSMSARNSGKWPTPPNPTIEACTSTTPTCVHPTSAFSATMAAALAGQLN